MASDRGTRGVIVVGVDGSVGAEEALTWAIDESRLHDDDVVLVHAWQFPGLALSSYAGEPLPVFGRDDLKELAQEMLAKVTEGAVARFPGVRFESRLVPGHPAAALVQESISARLLVVGSRGLGGFKGMLLGSVSTSCARHASCPVVVVPGGPDRS